MNNESLATNQLTSTEFKRQSSTFLNYIHNFRGLAILFIVAGHVIWSLHWKNDQPDKMAIILITNGTIFFVFIAGFLFQFLSQKYEYKKYLSKKIKYVIVPYLIVSIPALIWAFSKPSLPVPEWFKEDFSGWPIWGQVIMCLLTGAHLKPFWFIPMIAIFYIISPVLIWLDRNPRFYWLLPLLVMVTLIIPKPNFNNDTFQSFIHFFSIYVAGMFCSHFRERFFLLMERRYIFLIFAFIVLTALEYFWMLPPVNNVNSVNSVSKLILSVLLIYFFWLNEPRLPKILDRWMGLLAEFGFGIYFLHEYFILGYCSAEKKLGLISLLGQANPLAFTMSFALSVGGSVIVIVIVKKIFGKNSRWIIGC
jgi:uncharacterized membrane protein